MLKTMICPVVVPANSIVPAGLAAMAPEAVVPIEKGEPVTDVKLPFEFMLNTEMLLDELFITKRYPFAEQRLVLGAEIDPPDPFPPVEKGDPVTGVRTPPLETENALTVFGATLLLM